MQFLEPESLADGIEAFVYAIDYQTRKFVYINRVAREFFPHITNEDTCYGAFLHQDAPCSKCPINQLQQGIECPKVIKWIGMAKRWMQVKYSDLRLTDGTHVCIATGVDITPIQNALNNMERVLDSIHAAAYTVNPKTYRLSSINWELHKMLPTASVGDLCHQTLWDSPVPCSFCPIHTNKTGETACHFQRYSHKLNRHLSIDMATILGIDGDNQAVFTAYDITQLIESRQKLQEVAFTDVLTGLRNRIAFLNDMSDMFSRKKPCCLCSLNIKFVRRYNLLYGKKEGDKLLLNVASFFSAQYPANRVYRIDGAKLGFLAEGEEEISLLYKALEESEKNFHAQWENPNYSIFLDKAIVRFPDFADSPEEAVYNAEYILKKSGKTNESSYLVFNETEQSLLMRQNHVEAIVQEGLVPYRFQVYYQPIYDIQTKNYTKCEALLRLYDPSTGWISPVEFIPIAEETGTIIELGKFVLREVCQLLAERMASGLPPIRVNVNVSPVEITRKGFYEDVVSIVKQWNVSPKYIQLEVTESSFIASLEGTMEVMRELIAEGFTFAIDDFGTGYSSLNYIGIMPLECLKLDKSFMDCLLKSESYRLIVTNVIELAKDLHLSIVAEGIESEKQYELLKQLGSDYIQGFLFSKPLPRQEFEEFLNKNLINSCDK